MSRKHWFLQMGIIFTLVAIQNMAWRWLQSVHPDWVLTVATYVTAGAIGYIVNDIRKGIVKS